LAIKKRKRIRRAKGSAPRKLYFDENTQQAIVDFQSEEDSSEREKIYEIRILPSFSKLVENIILIYGFAKGSESFDVLKNDCITFLYETLYKFDNSKGTKAFSYFNVVAKNWLVLNSRRTRRITHNHLSLANQDRFSARDKDLIANYQIARAPDELMISQEFRGEIMKTLEYIRNKVKSSGKSKNDIACAEAIVTVFEQVDQLDFLNKRAIFVYVRNISGLNSKQLSASMSSIRKIYREYKQTNKDLF
jgi:hypothetical protein